MQKKKVLLITYGNRDHASTRIRALNHFDRLKDVFETTWVPRIGLHDRDTPFEKIRFIVLKALYTVKRNFSILFVAYDIVFVQTVFLKKWQLELLRKKGTKICFDFDDAIYTYSRYQFDLMIGYADKLVISTPFLIDDFDSAQKSYQVIYSPVDTDSIATVREVNKVFTIGWIGSPWTLLHLESIKEVFVSLSREIEFKMVIVGAEFQLTGVNIECIKWSEQNELNALKVIDVGIMPLDNHEWSPKKGGYKLYLYMAAGRPVIATPIGINGLIVKDGYNGFCANTYSDWENTIIRLANNSKLLLELGGNARHDAESVYSYNVCTAQLLEYLSAG